MEACLRVLVHIRNGRGQPARRAHGCQDAQRNALMFAADFVSLAGQGGLSKEICK